MTEVRSQNGWIVISGLLANPGGRAGRLAPRGRIVGRHPRTLPQECARAHRRGHPALCAATPDFAAAVVQFLADHPLASGPRRVAQSVERLGVNVAFADRERDRLARQLAGPPSPPSGRRETTRMATAASVSPAPMADARYP